MADAGRTYALLTIGDGLVAQIPALLLSVAVAILVTRVSRPHDMGQQIFSQVLNEPKALGVTAGILTLLGVIPGMPNVVFLSMAAAAAYGAYSLSQRRTASKGAAVKLAAGPAVTPAVPAEHRELSWDDVEQVDLIGLEVGYRLIPLVDRNQGGELMGRIKGVRKKLSEELGFLVQAVHIRDNLELGTEFLSHHHSRRTGGRIRSVPRSRAGHQSGPGIGHVAGFGDQGPGLWSRRRVDRQGSARTGAGAGLHRGGRQQRDRHAL